MTINPQRFGQKYVGKVANPQDILIFSKASKREKGEGKIDDSERLRPEELNQQNIEALVAENNLKMEILPVNDLDIALHNFVNKDEKMAFYNCVRSNIDETRNKLAKDSDSQKFDEDNLIVKVGECLEERVKQRSTRSKESSQFTAGAQSLQDFQGRSSAGVGSAVSFSDDEDAMLISRVKPSTRGRKGSSGASQTPARGRGRGRGRGKDSSSLKQTTLDGALGFRSSQRSASVNAASAIRSGANDEDNLASASSGDAEENAAEEIDDSSDDESKLSGRKRAAPRGRGRGSTQSSKRGRKSENASIHRNRMLMDNDDDDDEDDNNLRNRLNQSQPRATMKYGALRR